MISSYKDLTVWQRAMELVAAVYKLTALFPKEEIYGLISQKANKLEKLKANEATYPYN